jgi:hypothetical protein
MRFSHFRFLKIEYTVPAVWPSLFVVASLSDPTNQYAARRIQQREDK